MYSLRQELHNTKMLHLIIYIMGLKLVRTPLNNLLRDF